MTINSIITSQGKGTVTISTKNGNFDAGFIAHDAHSATTGNAKANITVDNSSGTNKSFTLSVIDPSSTNGNLKLRGTSISGTSKNIALLSRINGGC